MSAHRIYRTMVFFIPALLLMTINSHAEEFTIDSAAMVKAHNELRAGIGSPKVKWSEALEAEAVKRLKQLQKMGCVMKHSGPGKNLFWASAKKTANKKMPSANGYGIAPCRTSVRRMLLPSGPVKKNGTHMDRKPVMPPLVNPVAITRNWSGKTRRK
ncbi:MAG: CAP domain-containing protein [Desulfobulbaceae bacterium]|nr:CAP domain-containing protein [Desulfobulbaceae bacterium]